MATSSATGRHSSKGLLVLIAVFLAGCGSAGHGRDYSVQQVRAAFASQGIRLHENTDISTQGAAWLSSPAGAAHDPAVIAVVLSRPSAGQFSFQESRGEHGRLRRLGDVRVVWTARHLDTRVQAALSRLGRNSAPAEPKAKPPASPEQATSFAQTLAKIPVPLRSAVRRTAAAPSAHISFTGKEISGSGDYSTLQQIGALRMRAYCFASDEVIDGTTLYMRSSFHGRANAPRSRKWTKQGLQGLPAAARNGWPRAQLMTFAPPLAELADARHVSNLGRQTIDGIETTHYRTQLAFLNGLPPLDRRQMRNTSGIDVWVDKRDGYIRRVTSEFAGTAETVTLSRFGEPVHVTIPPAGQTTNVGKPGEHEKLKARIGLTACPRS